MRKSLTALAGLLLAGTAAIAADIPVKADPQPVRVTAPYSWTGAYVGGNVGYGRSSNTQSNTGTGAFGGVFPTDQDSRSSGVFYGAQAGYRYQFNSNLVAGVEVDFDWSNQKASTAQRAAFGGLSASTASSTSLDWLTTARGVIGIVPPGIPNALIYGTGGAAWGKVNIANSSNLTPGCGIGCGSASDNATRSGYAVGGGAEFGFARNWTVRAEYLHYDLGDVSAAYRATGGGAAPTFTTNVKAAGDIVRAAINYRF